MENKDQLLINELKNHLAMLEYFMEVFKYNNIGEIPDGFEVFYLSYEAAREGVKQDLGITKEKLQKLEEENSK